MVANIIRNPNRKDRMVHLLEELKEQKIESVIWWDGIFDREPKEGIRDAHFQVVRFAKEQGWKEVLIMEDDVKFTGEGAFDYYLSQKPKLYDLYLGGLSGGVIKNGVTADFNGLHLYMVHEQFYDSFLNEVRPDLELDCSMRYRGGAYFVCNPMVAKQYDGYSDNIKAITDYNNYWINYTFYEQGNAKN